MEKNRPKAPLLGALILLAVIVFLYFPLMMMFFKSFTWTDEHGQMHLTFKFLLNVLNDDNLVQYLYNSFIVGITTSFIVVAIGFGAATAISRLENKAFLKKFLKANTTLSLAFPEIVFALSLLTLFFLLKFQLSLFTVILAHVSFALPYAIITIVASLSLISTTLDDSARDLGASDADLLFKVHFPICKSAIISSFFLSFILSFDDFLITFFVNGVGSDTLPIKLYTAMKSGITPELNALATLVFLFSSVILFAITQTDFLKKHLSGKK